ncbi:DUF5691 domain-containing protein [Streptomonospora wellingtoniae]|uniref:DUF5691 domain-containing protein n=1 Tax=Streptomonospora wellingtoniae TaxID=3075544 RepID=A0ABU2KT82_9ACTN|nr:DUF5691 domain-containing protein [Streptomonospora sp. DSM 45055]MDT0302492.1 DUF5691 domain-containing protein [Streptomonospora sp. DSM 45055]
MTTSSETPPDPAHPAADSWSDLVSAALVGTARRSAPRPAGLPEVDRDDPAHTLLDRAALAAVRARAGRPADRAAPRDPAAFDPAPPETAPLPDPRAARRLADLLASDSRLLLEWLELAAQRGLRVPPELLPELLDRGARDHGGIGRALLPAAGRRGLWLAGLDPRWAYLLRLDEAQRVSAEEWRARPAQERHALLEAREPHLTADDEPLLQEAMGDRSTRVRGLARGLAARLPDTGRGRLLTGYARRHVRRGSDGRCAVRLPDLADTELARALGVEPRTDGGTRRDARERLWILVSYAPLAAWCGHLGEDPADVAAFAAAADSELYEALADAAVLQRDREWARALLPARLGSLAGEYSERAGRGTALLALLPPDEQCAWALRCLGSGRRVPNAAAVESVVEHVVCPWNADLAAFVADTFDAAERTGTSLTRLCAIAGSRMPPSLHERIAVSARRERAGGDGPEALIRLADTLRYRSEMHKEFS